MYNYRVKQPLLNQTNSQNSTPVIDTNNNIVQEFINYPLEAFFILIH
jgi:hypothetical protein